MPVRIILDIFQRVGRERGLSGQALGTAASAVGVDGASLLQRGLDPADKAERVRRYVENMIKEVGIIAHACGVDDPRRLRREHCRIVTGPGRSVPLSELYPTAKPDAGTPRAA